MYKIDRFSILRKIGTVYVSKPISVFYFIVYNSIHVCLTSEVYRLDFDRTSVLVDD